MPFRQSAVTMYVVKIELIENGLHYTLSWETALCVPFSRYCYWYVKCAVTTTSYFTWFLDHEIKIVKMLKYITFNHWPNIALSNQYFFIHSRSLNWVICLSTAFLLGTAHFLVARVLENSNGTPQLWTSFVIFSCSLLECHTPFEFY